jgi:hypothetical protein
MPWQIIKDGSGYFVETISTKRRHSKEPMTLTKAKAQLRILESKEKVGEPKVPMQSKTEKKRLKKAADPSPLFVDGPISAYRGRGRGKKDD